MRILFCCLLLTSALFADQKVALISGAHGGMGIAISKALHNAGWKVWAGYHRQHTDELAGIDSVELDVTSDESVQRAISTILEKDGKIDLLINGAGYGIIAAESEISIAEAEKLFQVNFFGAMRLTNAIIPHFQKQQKGQIINISSTSGVRAIGGLGLYAASKFALEGWSEALAITLSPYNIPVSIVQPGTVKNDWAAHCVFIPSSDNRLAENLLKKLMTLSKGGQPCEEIGQLIVNIAQDTKPHMRYQTSEKVKETVAKKLVDISGNSMRDEQILFFKSLVQ